jgi:hypothetical protein
MSKSKEPDTHFEQIPLEIVKEIAKEDIPDDEENGPDVIVESPAKTKNSISGSGVGHGGYLGARISRTASRCTEKLQTAREIDGAL